MTIAHRVAGPGWPTFSAEEVMEVFAADHRTRVALIETDGHTFQILSDPGVNFRVDDWISGWVILELTENGHQ